MPSVSAFGLNTGTLPGTSPGATGITITDAANQSLVVAVGWDITTVQVPTFSFNGDAIGLLKEATGTGPYMWVGLLKDPDTGAAFDITNTGAFNNVAWWLQYWVINDNDQTTPTNTANNQLVEVASGIQATATTTSASGRLVLGIAAVNNKTTGAVSPSAGTEIQETDSGGALFGGSVQSPGAASVASTWDWSGTTNSTVITLDMNAPAAVISSNVPSRRIFIMP